MVESLKRGQLGQVMLSDLMRPPEHADVKKTGERAVPPERTLYVVGMDTCGKIREAAHTATVTIKH